METPGILLLIIFPFLDTFRFSKYLVNSSYKKLVFINIPEIILNWSSRHENIHKNKIIIICSADMLSK